MRRAVLRACDANGVASAWMASASEEAPVHGRSRCCVGWTALSVCVLSAGAPDSQSRVSADDARLKQEGDELRPSLTLPLPDAHRPCSRNRPLLICTQILIMSRRRDYDQPNPWTPIPELSQTYRNPQPHQPQQAITVSGRPGPLQLLLLRLASKLEERTHAPWLALQQSSYFRDKSGIHSTAELDYALQHWHVALTPVELNMIFNAFPLAPPATAATATAAAVSADQHPPQPSRMMDMKALANALWKRDTEVVFGIRDGRPRSPKGRRRPTEPAKAEEAQIQQGAGSTQPLQRAEEEEQKQQTHQLGSSLPAPHASAPDNFVPYGIIGASSTRRHGVGVRRKPINDLHTPRPSTLLQRAAASALSGGQTSVGASARGGAKPLPHYMLPSNTRNLPPASVRADGAHTQRSNGAGASLTAGSMTSRDRAANAAIPRIDFMHLDKFEPRYERSQVAKDRDRQFVHTAR